MLNIYPIQDGFAGGRAASPRKLAADPALRRIWREVLGRKADAPWAGLLDMGIGARRLVRLLSAIEDATGVAIAPTTALQLGTFDALAAAVRCGGEACHSPLILLQPGRRGGSPLYLIAGGGGFILEQVEMARRIDHDGPVYGLQLPGLDGAEEPLASIEAMAAYFLDHVVPSHRCGPYHLIGYSFGGLVALEMARQLQADGRAVGMVGLLESNLHERHWPAGALLRHMAHRVGVHARALRRLPPSVSAARAAQCLNRAVAKIARRLRPAPSAARPFLAEESDFYIGGLPRYLQRVRDQSIAAFEAYAPGPIDVPVTLIKSRVGEPHFCDPALVWRRLVRDLDIVTVPGAHRTMVRAPYCGALADALSLRLRFAEQAWA